MPKSVPVVIDTSRWIDFFRRPDSQEAAEVAALIRLGRVATCGAIVAEILQGVRGGREEAVASWSLEGLPYLQEAPETWREVGRVARLLRRRGATVPLIDCLIAALASEYGCSIYTSDRDFGRIPGAVLHTP